MKRREKRWNKEKCRKEYVNDPHLSLKRLAEMSGWSRATLSHWSELDPDGTWAEQRRSHLSKIRSEIDKKTIEKTSEIASDALAELIEEHYRNHRLAKQIAVVVLQVMSKKLAIAQRSGDLDLVAGSINPIELNHWSSILDRHIKGERLSKGLDYLDINRAIDTVIKAGFEVIDPTDTAKDEEEDYIEEYDEE